MSRRKRGSSSVRWRLRPGSVGCTVVLVGLVAALWVGVCFGQMLYSPYNEEFSPEYENYAVQGYRDYTSGIFGQVTRKVFDPVGNFLMDGVELYSLRESRSDQSFLRAAEREGGSLLFKSSNYGAYLRRLVVASESYVGWSSRVILGERIRTKFTSLTLDMVQLNGIRWDIQRGSYDVALISSREDWPGYKNADTDRHSLRRWAMYLLGGHVERRFGIMNVSGTYVNQCRTNTLVPWGENSLKGVLPSDMNPVGYLVVRISDGAPRHEGGARVFDVRMEGELADLQPLITRHRFEFKNDADQFITSPDNRNGDVAFRFGQIPPYVEFIEEPQLLRFERPAPGQYLEAEGAEYLLYWFEMPPAARERLRFARFKARVANDYRIGVSEIYIKAGATEEERKKLGKALEFHRATYFQDVAWADGNVQDMSNLGWVRFEYGRQTARMNASVRVDVEGKGFTFRGELARSLNYLQFPADQGRGARWDETADALFLNAKKDVGSLSLGAEYFYLSPQYSTAISVEDREYESYATGLEDPFLGQIPGGPRQRLNNTIEFNTVDDNDDRDRYPDIHFLENGTDDFGDRFEDSGVFPGLDRDLNGRPDTNENGNELPDYVEPFLLYHSDPEEYDYGDDLNNNGIIDHREDDRKPDYPYDVDQKGLHLFAVYQPQQGLHVTAGRYDTQEITGAGRNQVTYAKLEYERNLFSLARIHFMDKAKRVKDDILDNASRYVQFVSGGLPLTNEVRDTGSAYKGAVRNYVREVEDPLLMRNSWVNTAFLDLALVRLRHLNLSQQLKSTVNVQRPSDVQTSNRIQEWAWVIRGDYTWQRGRWTIAPKMKFMLYRKYDRESRFQEVSERFLYPILTMDYRITENTALKVGAQGLPFLKSRFWNGVNAQFDYSSEDYVAMVSTDGKFKGYLLNLSLGWHLQQLEYEDGARASDNVDRSFFFLRLVMGLKPFEG